MVLKIKSVGIGVMKGWNDLREGHTVDAHLLHNSLGRAKMSFSKFLSFAVISRSRKGAALGKTQGVCNPSDDGKIT